MAGTATVEREYKFDADPAYDPPDLRPVVGRTIRLPELHMRTSYFDTPDGRLRAGGASLRHRSLAGSPGQDSDAGEWTLKVPSPKGGTSSAVERTEYTWAGRRDSFPAEAISVLAGIVRRADLAVVAELHTERRRLQLQRPDAKHPWAEIDDDVVVVVGGPADGTGFRQLEVELLPGEEAPPGEVDEVLRLLREAGARPSTSSKLSLALGEQKAPKHGRPSGVGDAVASTIGSSLERLLTADLRVRLHGSTDAGPDPHDIHQARVATRTLRSDLNTFAAVLDPIWLEHVTTDLRWAADTLGAVRDLDVLAERVEAHADPAEREGAVELIRLLAAERRAAVEALSAALTESRYLDMLDRLHAAALKPPVLDHSGRRLEEQPVGRAVAAMARQRSKDLDKRLRALPRKPSDQQLHKVRIRAKRLRYAAEAAEPFVGRPAKRTAEAAKELQNLLGDAHDAAVAVPVLRSLAARPGTPPAAAFVAGRLCGRAEADAGALRQSWRRAAKELGRKRNRSWL